MEWASRIQEFLPLSHRLRVLGIRCRVIQGFCVRETLYDITLSFSQLEIPSSALVGWTDNSQFDMLGLLHKTVNFGAEKSSVSTNQGATELYTGHRQHGLQTKLGTLSNRNRICLF